jgi:hypothetical protein
MAPLYKRLFDRNVFFALGVLPPALFLLDGHLWQGLLFLTCVVAGRFSVRPRLQRGSALPSNH